MSDPLDRLAALVDGIDVAARPSRGWPLGKALAHCAQSIEYSITAYPRLRSGLFRATIGPLAKRRFLRAGRMSHDVEAAIVGAPAIPDDEAVANAKARVHRAIAAFRAHTGGLAPHLAYGPCTKDEYAALHLLHVEDHLRAF